MAKIKISRGKLQKCLILSWNEQIFFHLVSHSREIKKWTHFNFMGFSGETKPVASTKLCSSYNNVCFCLAMLLRWNDVSDIESHRIIFKRRKKKRTNKHTKKKKNGRRRSERETLNRNLILLRDCFVFLIRVLFSVKHLSEGKLLNRKVCQFSANWKSLHDSSLLLARVRFFFCRCVRTRLTSTQCSRCW